jgi:hypothetical protein
VIDADKASEIISHGIAKLFDKYAFTPVPQSRFWIEMRYLIRAEIEALSKLEQ